MLLALAFAALCCAAPTLEPPPGRTAAALPALPAQTPLAAFRLPPDDFGRAGDRWLGEDKLKHFVVSGALLLSSQYVLTRKAGLSDGRALPFSAAAAAGAGLAKEVRDRRGPTRHFCRRDLAADAAGLLLGALVVAW